MNPSTAPREHGPSVRERILRKVSELTPREALVASTLLEGYPERALSSAAAIALASGTSTATVLRLVTRLGYSGLRDFHSDLRQEARSIFSASPFYNVSPSDQPLRDSVSDLEVAAVRETCVRITDDALAVTRAILTRPAVWVHGGRFSYPAALYLLNHLRLLRPKVSPLCAERESVADGAAQVSGGHGLVLFDFLDYDLEAAFAARYVRERRGKILLITDPGLSPAAEFADQVVVAAMDQPIPSLAAVFAALDMIVVDFVGHNQQAVRRYEDRAAASRQMLQSLRDERRGRRRGTLDSDAGSGTKPLRVHLEEV